MEKSCKNCNFFSKQLPQHIRINADAMKIIGECTNAKVQSRLCVSYGMLCDGEHHSERKPSHNTPSVQMPLTEVNILEVKGVLLYGLAKGEVWFSISESELHNAIVKLQTIKAELVTETTLIQLRF